MNQLEKEQVKIEIERRRWANRRRFAWSSFTALLTITFVMIFILETKRITVLEHYLTAVLTGLVAIIMTYIGTATWDNVAQTKFASKNKFDGAE